MCVPRLGSPHNQKTLTYTYDAYIFSKMAAIQKAIFIFIKDQNYGRCKHNLPVQALSH